jgi:hypothetical protein
MTNQEIRCHFERSEAIRRQVIKQSPPWPIRCRTKDGFVAVLVAMTNADQAPGAHPLHVDRWNRLS